MIRKRLSAHTDYRRPLLSPQNDDGVSAVNNSKDQSYPYLQSKILRAMALLVASIYFCLNPARGGSVPFVQPVFELIANEDELNCNDEGKSYLGMACAAEKVNIAHGEKAMLPLTSASATRHDSRHPRTRGLRKRRTNTCALCRKFVKTYCLDGSLYFKKETFDGKNTGYTPRRKVYVFHYMDVFTFFYRLLSINPPPIHPDEKYVKRIKNSNGGRETKRLRLDDAEGLFLHARDSFQKGEVINALALSSVARVLTHAAQPEEEYMKEGGMLYNGIIEYNKYLEAYIRANQKKVNNSGTSKKGDGSILHTLSSCPTYMDTSYKTEVQEGLLEPIYYDLRNFDYHELDILISMNPYRVLPTFPSVRERKYRKRILLDVGSNGFFGSPKALLDMYAPYQKFDEVHLFEPDLVGMDIPEYYKSQYSIQFHQMYVTVGTRDEADIVTWMEKNVELNDFVALKFDVDSGPRTEFTMEWGFLSDLIHSKAFELVDEFYTELHYYSPDSDCHWTHSHHSMRQAFEVISQLRQCGVAIHAWP